MSGEPKSMNRPGGPGDDALAREVGEITRLWWLLLLGGIASLDRLRHLRLRVVHHRDLAEPRRAAARMVMLEGIGAALILPAIVALVASNFGRDERPRAYGLVASAAAIAIAVGPIIGGLFTTYLSWRYVFAGEVLVVIAILSLARRMAEGSSPKKVRLDLVGTALSALGLGLIVFGILRSGTWGFVQPKPGAPEWLGLSPVIWLILGGGIVLLMFLAWEDRVIARGGEPLIDLKEHPQPAAARRPNRVPVPVLPAGRAVLRGAAVSLVALGLSAIETGVPAAAALADADHRGRRHPQVLLAGLAAKGREDRLRDAVRGPRRDGGVARRGGGRGDNDLADAARGCRYRVLWPRSSARSPSPRSPTSTATRSAGSEHDHQPRDLGRHGAHRRDRHRRADNVVPDRRGAELRRCPPRSDPGTHPAVGRRAVRLRRRTGSGLRRPHVPARASDAIVEENETARLVGLRTALSVLAIFALIALFFSRWIPAEQPARPPRRRPDLRHRQPDGKLAATS